MNHHINKNKLCNIDKVILLMLSLWLLVDMLNGLLLRLGSFIQISQLYKAVLVLIIVLGHLRNKRLVLSVIGFVFYICIWGAIVFYFGANMTASLVLTLKPVTSIIIYLYFCYLIHTYSPDIIIKKFVSILKISVLIFSINILLGLVGIGYSSYEGSVNMGYCGFFYSPNELSGVVAVLFPLTLAYVKINKSNTYYILIVFFLAFISYLIGTKSPIIICIVSTLLITYLYGRTTEKRSVIICCIILSMVIIKYIHIIGDLDVSILQRLVFFIEKNGLADALLSGRMGFWNETKSLFYNSNIITRLFGLGGGLTVEMDPFDFLLNYGYIGFAGVIILYIWMLCKPISRNNVFKKAVFTSNLLLVFMSIFAGHILLSSTAGLYIALSNSLLEFKDKGINTKY